MRDWLATLFSDLGGKYYWFGLRVRWRARFARYDFCHAMDAMSLFAVRGLAARGVPVLLDVNEIADPFERQGARFVAAAPRVKRHLAAAFARDIQAARAVIATSDAMADFMSERFGRDTLAIRNARAPLAAPPSTAIRDDVGGDPDTRVIAYPCTAAPHLGVEASVEMLTRLPENYRLIFIGRFITPAYRETIERLIRFHCLERRVLLKGELPDGDYLPYLGGSDIGLVPLSFAYRNQRLVLPWRAIDLAAAQVPMVATPSEAMLRLARDGDIGEIAASSEPNDLAAAITRMASSSPDRIAAIKHNLGALASDHSPQNEAARYRDTLRTVAPHAGRAAIVANLALRNHRRLIGFVDQACAMGWRVDLYCVRAPDRALFRQPDRVRFVEKSDRLLPRGWLLTLPRIGPLFAGWWFGVRQLRRSMRYARAVRTEAARHGPWDIVIATDIFALAAGLTAGKSFLVYDATEIPDFRQRTALFLRRIPALMRLPFRWWEREFVRRAGLIVTPSRALAGYLRRRYRKQTGAPIVTIRNVADGKPVAGPSLRERLSIPASDIVMVSPCGISLETGGLVAARSLRFLPADHVLVFIGRFSNAEAEEAVRAALRRDRTEHRCFFVGEADYGTYLSWLGECDVGLVLFDPAIANLRLAAPNRFFDLLAARVPMIATEIDEVAAILRRTGIGAVVRERRPATVARTVTELRARLGIAQGGAIHSEFRARLDRVAALHAADKEQARLVAALTRRAGDLHGKRVALLTLRCAFANRRFRRIAATLREAGATVTAFDTDIGRRAPAAEQPDWLTTVAIASMRR